MTDQFWLWLGFAGMAIGSAAIFFLGDRRTPKEETATILHGVVPIIAACSYFAMAVGQGSVLRPSGVEGAPPEYVFYFARYIDWLFTTPLLLTALTLTGMHSGLRRPGLLVGIVAADVLMIVTALFFGLSATAWIKWTWFAISTGAFLAIYYVIWGPLRAENARERPDVQAVWKRNAATLSVVWFVYPVILFFDPEGLGMLGSAATTMSIAVLDLVAKVVYGLLATVEHSKIARTDQRDEGGAVVAPGRARLPV